MASLTPSVPQGFLCRHTASGVEVGQHETSGTTGSGGLRSNGRHRLASDVQVLIGVGSLLALLAVAVGLAVLLIVSFEDDATDDASRHVGYATAIHEAALSAKGIANDQRGFLLSGNTVYLSEIRERTADARTAFTLADSFAVGAAHRDALEQSRAGFEHWLAALNGDIAEFRHGAREEAIEASLGSTRDLRKTYEESLAHAYLLGVRSIDSSTASLSSSATRSVTLLLSYLAFALLVGVGVALWVVRALLRPAFTLSQNAIEVLNQGYVLVSEDDKGSHHGVSVVVPIETVNALAESALETQESLRPGSTPAA
jgi:CHASE3 domain sensor protein